MKIGVAQIKAVKGDIEKNRQRHRELIAEAVHLQADMIVFPELSLTGFEPELAADLAKDPADPGLDDFQELSDTHRIIIGIGLPTTTEEGNHISLLLFKPAQPRQVYSKQVLHPDEYPFFIPGTQPGFLAVGPLRVAVGICYETSLPEHPARAARENAAVYVASTLHAVSAIQQKLESYALIARKFQMIVLMANYAGTSGGYDCAGRSSIWLNDGQLAGQLNDRDEGILILDTASSVIESKYVEPLATTPNYVT